MPSLVALLGWAASTCYAEDSLIPSVLGVDVEYIVIRQAPKGRYAMYGGLTKLPDGVVFCVYKVGSRDPKTGSPWTVRDETIVWTRSSNQGRDWPGTENLIYKNPATRQENCCGTSYLAKDGRLIHPFYTLNSDYEERAQPQNWCHLHLAETRDMGKTWSTRQLKVPLHLATSFGGIVPLRDGTLLLHAYGSVEPNSFRHQSGILRSSDDGKTWGDYTVIGEHADPDGGPARLNETDIAELPSGKLLSMSRTQYNGYPLYRGVSQDGGRTWEAGPAGLTGLCPALCFTQSGPPEGILVLIWHDRYDKHADKGGVYVAFSTDEGKTWGTPVWMDGGAYPCIIEMAPGRVFASYYRGSTLLRAALVTVPFPSGLRVEQNASAPATLELAWDAYRGKKADDYTYRVYRSTQPEFVLSGMTPIGTIRNASSFRDDNLKLGQAYFYKVVAHDGDRRVGVSWVAGAKTTGARP